MKENVNFVAKTSNPPNVPQARPIKDFWGCLAQKVYVGGYQAKTEQQMIRRIKLKLKEFYLKYLQTLMGGIKRKLRSIADNGFFFYFLKLIIIQK